MKFVWKSRLRLLLQLALAALPLCRGLGLEDFQPLPAEPLLEPWRARTYLELSGLGVHCIGEGKNGTMWFGTARGLWSYDGWQWTSYEGQPGFDGGVRALCTGRDGTIYAGTAWGINFCRGTNWSGYFGFRGRPCPIVKGLLAGHDGAFWAATSWGLLRLKGRDSVFYTGDEGERFMRQGSVDRGLRLELLPQTILGSHQGTEGTTNRFDLCEIQEDREGQIWLGTEAGEVMSLKPATVHGGVPPGPGGEWVLYQESSGLSRKPHPRLLPAGDGSIWVVSRSVPGPASRFDGSRWKDQRLESYGVPEDYSSLLQTRDGVLWLGCNGAVAANRDGHWQVYEPPRAPVPSVRTLLFQSSDGALWLAGRDAEIVRVDYQTPRWTTYRDLNFQWESPRGAQWFLHRSGRVVVHDGARWQSYGPEDGLIDAPTSLLGTRTGEVWAAGSDHHVAATGRFDGKRWKRVVQDDLSWGVDWRCAFEASDGSLWFGAAAESAGAGTNYSYGLWRYQGGKWFRHTVRNYTVTKAYGTNVFHFADPERTPAGKYHGLGESRRDGRIWTVDVSLSYSGHKTAGSLSFQQSTEMGAVETLFTSKEGELWAGSRQFGVFRYDGRAWQHYDVKDGLVAHTVRGLTQTPDGSIWAATDHGVSRFDGHAWVPDALPRELNIARDGGSLKASASGAVWLNRVSQSWNLRAWPGARTASFTNAEFWSVCFRPSSTPPRTLLTLAADRVPQPGNLTLSWKGQDPWQAAADSHLRYSYRLDAGPWSPYAPEEHHAFFTLPGGRHHFEVRARNDDFALDPQPASLDFVVLPPVWKQGWFLGLVGAFLGIIGLQAARIISRSRHLRRSNCALAAEVEERKRAQFQAEQAQKQLVEASHRAGMAEIATNILHNVGNVLNSANVSADLLSERVRRAPVENLPKVANLLAEHAHEPEYLAQDEKGKRIPGYLKQLGERLVREQQEVVIELGSLQHNINHIKEIVAKQREYSHLGSFKEAVELNELVEDAVRLNEGALTGEQIKLRRAFSRGAVAVAEKQKVLQILVNVLQNAREACEESGRPERQIAIETSKPAPNRVRVRVSDNGVGIPPENLVRIFSQDFTTRRAGHSYGLHTAANAAREMGGSLTAQSAGPGLGAVFTLDLPAGGTGSGSGLPEMNSDPGGER